MLAPRPPSSTLSLSPQPLPSKFPHSLTLNEQLETQLLITSSYCQLNSKLQEGCSKEGNTWELLVDQIRKNQCRINSLKLSNEKLKYEMYGLVQQINLLGLTLPSQTCSNQELQWRDQRRQSQQLAKKIFSKIVSLKTSQKKQISKQKQPQNQKITHLPKNENVKQTNIQVIRNLLKQSYNLLEKIKSLNQQY